MVVVVKGGVKAISIPWNLTLAWHRALHVTNIQSSWRLSVGTNRADGTQIQEGHPLEKHSITWYVICVLARLES